MNRVAVILNLDQPPHVAMWRLFMYFDISVIPQSGSGKLRRPHNKIAATPLHQANTRPTNTSSGLNVLCLIYRHEVRLEVDRCADDLPTGAVVRAADGVHELRHDRRWRSPELQSTATDRKPDQQAIALASQLESLLL